MLDFFVNIPTKVIFGPGKSSQLGTVAQEYGSKAFVIITPFLKGTLIAQTLLSNIRENGLETVECYEVTPNPRNTTIDAAAQKCADEKCDLVIGIGGGSAIDTAKAVAIVAVNGGNSWEYTTRANQYVAPIAKKPLPLISIPTTAGTGTEVTPYAVINNPQLLQKSTIGHELVFPTISIVDAELMTSMSGQLTALTGIDAFSHAFEAYININATQFSDMISLEAIKLFVQSIKDCCEQPDNIAARNNMALSSMLAGLAIAHSPTTAPHAIGQPLSGKTDAPHGASIACCIAQIVEWTLPQGEDKFAKVAEIFDPSITNLTVSEKASKLPGLMRKIFSEILQEPVTFGTYGIKEEDVSSYVDSIISSYGSDLERHPKVAARQDLMEIVKKCL